MNQSQTLLERWNTLSHLTNTVLVQSIADKELSSKYQLLLNGVRHDKTVGEDVFLGLMRAPGSKDRHHDVEGGLVIHLLEMWDSWLLLRNRVISKMQPITDSLVWRAILHHDLNKVWRYKWITKDKDGNILDKWKVDYAEKGEDALGYLLPSTYKTIGILNRYEIPLPPLLLNALITAEGGFSQGPRPKTETVFAKLVYLLDELSANVFNRLDTGRFWDSLEGGLRDGTTL